MALDDKRFQSAIAKINKIKSKQSIIPQIQVFEDPPHLRKSINNYADDTNVISERHTSFNKTQSNVQSNIHPQDRSPQIESGHSSTHVRNDKIRSDVINTPNNTDKYDTDSDTKYSTKKGTEWGTEIVAKKIVVQKNSTNSNTLIDTKKSTASGYSMDVNPNVSLPAYPEFVYQRPYDSLAGIPKKIVDVIFEICKKYGVKETPPIPFAMLVRLCNEKKNSVKVTRQRLLDEGIIETKNPLNAHARGRSGMLIYKLREDLFDEINDSLSLFMRTNDAFHNRGTKYGTDQSTRVTSSSSKYNKSTTTALPDEWKKIDFTALKEINFGIAELKNIYKKCPDNITPQIIQDSINQFAFGMANNPDRYKTMHAPAGVLISKLSQGISWEENGYISPEEKLRREKENKITKLFELQFKEPKFVEWFNSLDENKKDALVPPGVINSASYLVSKSIIQKEHAHKYFEHEIWPSILTELKSELI